MASFYPSAAVAGRPLKTLLQQYDLENLPLDRAVLAIAEPHCEELDPERVLRHMNLLARKVRDLVGTGRSEDCLLQGLIKVLFEECGFRGNRSDYYNPENSFLNRVLETRKGIPISLSLLMIEVGRRLGIRLVGIGLPCHFIVGFPTGSGMRYFDPYQRGREKSLTECVEYVSRLAGGSVEIGPQHFLPVSRRLFLSRMLVNLRCIYRYRQEAGHLVGVLRQLALLNPGDPIVHVELASLLADLGNPWEAHHHFTTFLKLVPESESCRRVQAHIQEIGKKLAILN